MYTTLNCVIEVNMSLVIYLMLSFMVFIGGCLWVACDRGPDMYDVNTEEG